MISVPTHTSEEKINLDNDAEYESQNSVVFGSPAMKPHKKTSSSARATCAAKQSHAVPAEEWTQKLVKTEGSPFFQAFTKEALASVKQNVSSNPKLANCGQ